MRDEAFDDVGAGLRQEELRPGGVQGVYYRDASVQSGDPSRDGLRFACDVERDGRKNEGSRPGPRRVDERRVLLLARADGRGDVGAPRQKRRRGRKRGGRSEARERPSLEVEDPRIVDDLGQSVACAATYESSAAPFIQQGQETPPPVVASVELQRQLAARLSVPAHLPGAAADFDGAGFAYAAPVGEMQALRQPGEAGSGRLAPARRGVDPAEVRHRGAIAFAPRFGSFYPLGQARIGGGRGQRHSPGEDARTRAPVLPRQNDPAGRAIAPFAAPFQADAAV